MAFHIKGEKIGNSNPDLQAGIQQMAPTVDLMGKANLGVLHTNDLNRPSTNNKTRSDQKQITPLEDLKGKGNQVGPSTPMKQGLLPMHAKRQPTPDLKRKATKPKSTHVVKVLRSIYGLKQSGRIWYKKFMAEMLSHNFINNDTTPCLFIKHVDKEFVIIAIYVDDLTIFGTPTLTNQTTEQLRTLFEMKDIGKPTLCLGLQFDYLPHGILINQATYTKKIIKQFNMHHSKSVSTPMDLRSLDLAKDMFKRRMEHEPILGFEKPYLSAIGALMYLANQTRPDIAFSVNLLARHSSKPTIRHWNGIKRIFRYLQGTIDTGLFFPNNCTRDLIGYTDAGYLSDPVDSKSQTGYVFLIGPTAISWKSCKQTLTTTSSNHSEIIALYEACKECIKLRETINHIDTSCGLPSL